MNIQGSGSLTQPAVSNNYCTAQVKKIVDGIKESLQNLAENVCLEYLAEPVVVQQFRAKVTAVVGAGVTTGKVTKGVEDSYFDTLTTQINGVIETFIKGKLITEQSLFAFQKSILVVFVNSALFKYFDGINSIDKLRKRVKKIDD